MQIILIDREDKPLAYDQLKAGHGECTLIQIPATSSRTAFDIANEVNKKIVNPWDTLLFLNVNLKNQQQGDFYYGIEVLKEIRSTFCYEEESKIQHLHVVLFSVFSLEHLLRIDSSFFVAASPATTFIRSQYQKDLGKLNFKELAQKVLPGASVLKPYFKVSDHTLENRHNYSNLWAANRLIFLLEQLVSEKELQQYIKGLIHFKPSKIRDAQFIYEGTASSNLKLREVNQANKRLNTYRRKLSHTGQKKILLIDDQATNIDHTLKVGWQTIYSLLIFSTKTDIHLLSTELTNKEIIDQIDDSYDCILLDLLLEKEDLDLPVEETRGAVLLRQIKRKMPFLPVIITTASNKAEKRKTLRQLGSEAYWIKEGIDERLVRTESLNRFLKLPQLLVKLTGEEFQFLKKSMQLLKRLETETLWWEDHHWNDKRKITLKKSKVIEKITNSLFLIRTYLQNLTMGEGYRTKLEERFWFSGIIIKLCGIISHFHAGPDHSPLLPSLIEKHYDPLGSKLYALREKAAQFDEAAPIDFACLSDFMKKLFDYLLIEPYKEHPLGVPLRSLSG